jgi:hypothetical protein
MILSMVGYHSVKNEKEAVHSARATRSARRINHRQQSGPLCFESSYMIKGV